MTPKCKSTFHKVLFFLMAVFGVLTNYCIHYTFALATVQLSDQELGKRNSADDVGELTSYVEENDVGKETNEKVVGAIREQFGITTSAESETAAALETEVKHKMRWKQRKSFESENVITSAESRKHEKKEDEATATNSVTLAKRKMVGRTIINSKAVSEDLGSDEGEWWIQKRAELHKTMPHAQTLVQQMLLQNPNPHKVAHHLRREHQHKQQSAYKRKPQTENTQQQQHHRREKHKHRRHNTNHIKHLRKRKPAAEAQQLRKHQQQQHKHKNYFQHMQYSFNNNKNKERQHKKQQRQQLEADEPNTKRKVEVDLKFSEEHMKTRKRFHENSLQFLPLHFVENTHEWHYQSDDSNIVDKPMRQAISVNKQTNSKAYANGNDMTAVSEDEPKGINYINGSNLQDALMNDVKSQAVQGSSQVHNIDQPQRVEHKHTNQSTKNLMPKIVATTPSVYEYKIDSKTDSLLLMPTYDEQYHYHNNKDTHWLPNSNTKWQSYTSDIELHAAARSGRHRGRHVTLPTTHLMSYNPIANVRNTFTAGVFDGGSKVFRSLPDSEDFNYEQHVHRVLVTTPQRHWPVKHEAIVEGDVILGGLMMVHSREDTITCGPIMPQGGIQALEAMLYTIDRVNEAQLLPNITLGAHILDDCDKDSYGLEMAVDFIKGSISNIDDAEYHCNKTQVRKVISGVVGAASSVTSIQVANLLRLFRIPQVSFFSTSPELSNKQRFEYFSRTIPSDHYQVKAMVEIVKRMGWSYVSIIYEESNYGIKAFEELEDLLARHNICIAVKEKLVKDSGVAEEIAYDNIVQKLLTKPRARGAIIFGSDQEVREVMRAVRRNNATGAFSWIGSDGWSARNLVSDGNEPEVEGTLSVQPQANPVKGFEEYFLNLTVENNQRNPWFVEFWEDHFQCRYPGSLSTPYNNYNRTCTTKERLSKDTDFEDQLQFVSDAVMAFAYALRDMHRDLCGGRPSLCEAMRPTKGSDLLKYLRKVQFQGLSGDHFRFDANGDGPARYNIIHFKQSAEGLYHWVKVGEYYEGELRLNMTEVQFKLLDPKPPESVCSLPCERGQAKKYVEGESCCWHCFNCSTYQIRHPIDETQCLTCQLGTLPDATKQICQKIPEIYLRPESAWAIGAMVFSATGILVTLFVVGVFMRHNDTPIVRASGRELSYILLAGILMCYAVTFALVLKPTNIVCAFQRFIVGFCFTVVYAALLTKTNRIARIFKAGKQSAKRPSFISPKSQLVICSFLIFIQILINGVWMVIAPSHAMYHHPTREDNLLVCDSYIDASYMIAFFYPIILIVVCTIYAVLTRKIPEAFNESKHIGFTMYTTCVIWLAFVPLYFGTANHVPLRITSMSVTISLSASVTIACLFTPKLYIILIRPERNVRQSMMPPRYGNMHRTAGTGPSSMMAAAVVTAATCAQEEKIQKHITPTSTENGTKQLCEMATQTITITNIFTNLDSITYSQIPYADQCMPNSNQHLVQQTLSHPLANTNNEAEVVANNNKINQLQHGNPCATHNSCINAAAITTTTTTPTPVATTAVISTANTITAVAPISATTTTKPATLHALSNNVMLQQNVAEHDASSGDINTSPNGASKILPTNEFGKSPFVTTSL
ncbi:metabotropic glutamate receptor 2 [Eurosta solidaginis]|uniref:metabotropic glutamate receptor 2 n=1 Tax=Eurosta solidaginis TaxID=178769 RepID=UPI0035313828